MVTIRCLGDIATTKFDSKSKVLQIFDKVRPKLSGRPFLRKHKTCCTTTSLTELAELKKT